MTDVRHSISHALRRWKSYVGVILALGVWASTVSPVVAQPARGPADSTRTDSTRADTVRHAPVRLDTADVAWIRRLPELSVRAVRQSIATAPRAAHVQTLDANAIARSGAEGIDDVLALRSAAFIRQYGDNGLSTLSLRGMGGSQTLVLLDGMRVADPQTGHVDLSLLPTLLVESVSVEHGGGSARYGSGSLGGTVHLRTMRPTTEPRVRAASGGGAFGERHASAVLSDGTTTASGTWSGLVAGRAYTSDGDFPYTNRFLVPQKTVRRKGARTRVSTLYGRAGWQAASAAAHRWSVATWWTHAERGLPGPASTSPTGAEQTDRQGRVWVDGSVPVRNTQLRIQAQATAASLHFQNPATRVDETTRTRTADVSAWMTWPVRTWGLLDTGVSWGTDYSSIANGIHETNAAAFVDGSATIGRLRVEPALRFDARTGPSTTNTALAPRLGLSVRPLPTDGLRLNALVARAFRLPTFNERYYEPGGRPTLQPEVGWSAEVGVELRRQRPSWSAQATLTGFRSSLSDKIVWQPGVVDEGIQVWRPANVSRVLTRGLEARLRGAIRPTDALTLRMGTLFTHTLAENRANPLSPAYGSQLPYVPEQQLKLWTHLSAYGASLGATARLVGPRFFTADESKQADPYQVVDLTARYARTLAGVTLRLSGQIHNVLDERYDIIRLYPMPPRHASVQLSVLLSP